MHKYIIISTLLAIISLTENALASNSISDPQEVRAFAQMPRVPFGFNKTEFGLDAMAACYQDKGKQVRFEDRSPRNHLSETRLTHGTLSEYLNDVLKIRSYDVAPLMSRSKTKRVSVKSLFPSAEYVAPSRLKRAEILTASNLLAMEEAIDSESSSGSHRSVIKIEQPTPKQSSWASRL